MLGKPVEGPTHWVDDVGDLDVVARGSVRPVSVLWLTGAPGVGKSTVGWALYERARAESRPVAYVDIDQLGLMAPAPAGDPHYHRLKTANLVEVLGTFRRHGAEQVIVSGIVDPYRGIRPYLTGTRDFEFTLVRLRCGREELRRRYLGRGSADERIDEAMSIADLLDRNAVGTPLDTTALSQHEIVDILADRLHPPRHAQSSAATSAHAEPVPSEQLPVLLLLGPTAVGKSTVGWEVLRTLWSRGITAAFVDADQLGFLPTESATSVRGENLARVWRGYRRAGARALVVVARGQPLPYQQVLAGGEVTTVRLAASENELARRITQRSRGHGPRLAGDSLIGISARQQAQVLSRSASEAAVLHRRRVGGLIIDTDHRSASAVAVTLADLLCSNDINGHS